MILYTTMPMEIIMEGFDKVNINYKEINVKENLRLIIEPIDNFSAKVIRIISSDPMDYLNPEYQPGNIILFKIS
ncbi:MAG: YlzJ-like family protein [Thermovenabulum sp.]|uniref:YlzJ-like family protein n=1 Tax=Thermovenabulum sp. TaxID=3100335 RepID=UPI003C7B0743